MNFLGFGQSAEVDIVFDGAENRKLAEIKTEDGKKEKYLLYYDGETVSGKVNVTLKKPGSKLEHQGIKIELIGQIELFYDRGNHHEFTSLVKELARPGDLIQNTSYPFEFMKVEKPFEVYVGSNVRLRYFLRVTVIRRISDIIREVDIAVHTLCTFPDLNSPIKMEVGIEDCLHIEFEYNKSKYHLKDVIVGKIYFLLVRIKIKHMEIAIIKRETTGTGPNTYTENETIAKYEIMDGAPVKGESIPIRVFLAGYDLTPTMRDINKKFSVKYFLNLVLMDTEDRRYFKQQEITLWRKADKSRKSQSQSTNNPHVPTHLVGGPDNDMSTMSSTKHSSIIASDYRDDGTGVIGIGGPGSDDGGNTEISVNTDNGDRVISSELDGNEDPRMGLFTRESPQESKRSNDEKIHEKLTVEAPQQQRGTGDGSSIISDEQILINDNNNDDNDDDDGNGSLFNTSSKIAQGTNDTNLKTSTISSSKDSTITEKIPTIESSSTSSSNQISTEITPSISKQEKNEEESSSSKKSSTQTIEEPLMTPHSPTTSD